MAEAKSTTKKSHASTGKTAKERAAEAIVKNDAEVIYMTEQPEENPIVEFTYEARPLTQGEKVAVGVFVAACAGVVGLIGWAGWKQEKEDQAKREEQQAEWKRKREEREAWLEEQRVNGNLIVEQRDGTYIAIPAEVYAKAPRRRKAV